MTKKADLERMLYGACIQIRELGGDLGAQQKKFYEEQCGKDVKEGFDLWHSLSEEQQEAITKYLCSPEGGLVVGE